MVTVARDPGFRAAAFVGGGRCGRLPHRRRLVWRPVQINGGPPRIAW